MNRELSEALAVLEAELVSRKTELKYKLIIDVFNAFQKVLLEPTFNFSWGATETNKVYFLLLNDDDLNIEDMKTKGLGRKKFEDEEAFRINVTLGYLLKVIKKGLPDKKFRISRMPRVNYYPRPSLALNKNFYPFSDLDKYDCILKNLLQWKPTSHAKYEELCVWLILRLIAVDGLLIGDVDRRIVCMRFEDIYERPTPWLSLLLKSGVETLAKQYPITNETADAFRIWHAPTKLDT